MGRGDNYPDDIRNYDHDPRSPFYESGPECDECGEEMSVEIDADEDLEKAKWYLERETQKRKTFFNKL